MKYLILVRRSSCSRRVNWCLAARVPHWKAKHRQTAAKQLLSGKPRTFEHSSLMNCGDTLWSNQEIHEWTTTPYDVLTFALPHSWLSFHRNFPNTCSGSHCCFPTCRHVLKREASSRHECLKFRLRKKTKVFQSKKTRGQSISLKKKPSCYGFKVEELGCWKVEFSFCCPIFSCAAPCQEAQEILQMAGQGSEEPISISNTLQSLGASRNPVFRIEIRYGSGVLQILHLTKLHMPCMIRLEVPLCCFL